MRTKMRKILSGLLALVMLVGLCQISTFAADLELKLDAPITVTPKAGKVAATFKPDESGHYTFASKLNDGSDPVLYKIADASGKRVKLVTGEWDDYEGYDFKATYFLNAGEIYTLQFTDYNQEDAVNGFQVTVSKSAGMLHQPSVDEPYVTMSSFDTVKGYQWHELTYAASATVTNQNATALDTEYGKGSYDSTIEAWIATDSRHNCYDVLEIELEQGVRYCVEVMDDSAEVDSVHFMKSDQYVGSFEQELDGKYYYTADENRSTNLRVFSELNKPLKIKLTKQTPVLSDKLAGQTTNTLTDFEEGKDYLCVIEYADGTKLQSDVVTMAYAITHEPTAAEPYVSVNNTNGAAYQWHKMKLESVAVTDENAYEVNTEGSKWSEYDSSTGKWIGAINPIGDTGEYVHLYFEIWLTEGEEVTVEFDEEPNNCRLYLNPSNDGTTVVQDGKKYTFTAQETSIYRLEATCDTDSNPVTAVHKTWVFGDPVAGQTTDTLTSYDKDTRYACKVSYKNGTELLSAHLKLEPQVLRHPTAEKPSVEVSYPQDVKSYQWYEMEEAQIEINDENAEPMQARSKYDSETGTWSSSWYGTGAGEYEHVYFVIDLKAGDVLTLEASDTPTEDSALQMYTAFGEADKKIDGNKIQFTVIEDGTYVAFVITNAEDTTIKASKNGYKLGKKLEGQTGASLTKMEKDKLYACVVTYQDGLSLTSDVFKATETIDDSKVIPSLPPTGDHGALGIWIGLLLVSGAGLVVLGYDKRRKYLNK